jgi:hypothetical protein
MSVIEAGLVWSFSASSLVGHVVIFGLQMKDRFQVILFTGRKVKHD